MKKLDSSLQSKVWSNFYEKMRSIWTQSTEYMNVFVRYINWLVRFVSGGRLHADCLWLMECKTVSSASIDHGPKAFRSPALGTFLISLFLYSLRIVRTPDQATKLFCYVFGDILPKPHSTSLCISTATGVPSFSLKRLPAISIFSFFSHFLFHFYFLFLSLILHH